MQNVVVARPYVKTADFRNSQLQSSAIVNESKSAPIDDQAAINGTDIHAAKKFLSEGVNSYNNGDFDNAISYYEKALNIFSYNYRTDIHPDVAICFESIGDTLVAKENFRRAQRYYQRAIEIYSCITDYEENCL